MAGEGLAMVDGRKAFRASEQAVSVDVERRSIINRQTAGLKRLSARASKGPTTTISTTAQGCFSFALLARTVMDHLRKLGITIATGLSEEEFSRVEAPFAFTFPPDLKAILQEGLPSGAGFPDWRSAGSKQLRLALSLPAAGICYEVAGGRLWLKQWGPKPCDTEKAVHIARSALRKAPILVPVYRNCYIPASPNLAGNPVFFVCRKEVSYCGHDLASFFDSFSLDSEFPTVSRPARACNGRTAGDWIMPEKWQSFRLEKQITSARFERVDEIEHADMAREAPPEVKCEENCRQLEGWGRNLDFLAKKSTVETAPRRSFEMSNSRIKALRCVDQSMDRSNDHHPDASHRRVISAKAPSQGMPSRRIEFWSELARNRQEANEGLTSRDHLFSCTTVDRAIEKDFERQEKHVPAPYWLERYLDQMAMVLRNAGWREADVAEMFGVISPPLDEPTLRVNSLSIMEGLVLYVNLLSDILRRAGWSAQDVAESFDVDLSFGELKRRAPAIPPHIAARISKLAEHVGQF